MIHLFTILRKDWVSLGVNSDVVRNDKITIDEIRKGNYDAIIISPGPGTPEDKKYFGICSECNN